MGNHAFVSNETARMMTPAALCAPCPTHPLLHTSHLFLVCLFDGWFERGGR